MKTLKIFVLLLSISLLSGCSINPRVVECDKCGQVWGRVGGLIPGQGSYHSGCGGHISTVRYMTQKEWKKSKERGYIIK